MNSNTVGLGLLTRIEKLKEKFSNLKNRPLTERRFGKGASRGA